jgi:hypothetical protein
MNTAAVFHLMRVVEIALRATARKLKVKYLVGRSGSRCPINSPSCPQSKPVKVPKKTRIEYAQWQQIIDELNKRIKHLPSHTKDAAAMKDAMLSFSGFKDVWRNHVAHSRETYDADKARKAYGQVENFMQELAKVVSE